MLAELGSEHFVVDPFVAFSEEDWQQSPSAELARIVDRGLGPLLAVRSSADSESIGQTSPPGAFRSELGVPSSDAHAIATAVEAVFGSIDTATGLRRGVVVQTQVTDVTVAGVATTLDLQRRPYLTVEFDDKSGTTDRVTSGQHVQRVVLAPNWCGEGWLDAVCRAVQQITSSLQIVDLVLEFAIDHDGTLHVFQAWERGRSASVSAETLAGAVDVSARRLASQRLYHGQELVLSDMADWNPAEMLGQAPGALDVSLYRRLITDRTWARARQRLGYFDCPGPLLVEILGHPYVNVRQSFRSLTPSGLSDSTRSAYIEGCSNRLCEEPWLHDKVEHDLLTTYWPLRDGRAAMPHRAPWLTKTQLEEFRTELIATTAQMLSSWASEISWAQKGAQQLGLWRSANPIDRLSSMTVEGLLSFVTRALRVCRAIGTLPFSSVARLAFVADGLARELADAGDIDPSLSSLWQRVQTPADRFAIDLADERISLTSLAARYGHLRPHTYNIESLPYAARDGFLAALRESSVDQGMHALKSDCTTQANVALSEYFEALGVPPPEDPLGLLASAFSARESHKFHFTAVLSDALEALAELGVRLDLSRAEVRRLSIRRLLTAGRRGDSTATKQALLDATRRDNRHALLQWPDFISGRTNLLEVDYIEARPTYIGQRIVDAPLCHLNSELRDPRALDGSIVVIEAADPGFDWIFTQRIAGLITCYGGSSSHMAIRCHELSLPAAIGCGRTTYQQLVSGTRVILDCRNGSIVQVARS
jgi:phosphohistidine swiveling domain-containing protein